MACAIVSEGLKHCGPWATRIVGPMAKCDLKGPVISEWVCIYMAGTNFF